MESLSIAAVIIMNMKKKSWMDGHGRINQTNRLIDSKVTLRNIKILNISRKSFPFSSFLLQGKWDILFEQLIIAQERSKNYIIEL